MVWACCFFCLVRHKHISLKSLNPRTLIYRHHFENFDIMKELCSLPTPYYITLLLSCVLACVCVCLCAVTAHLIDVTTVPPAEHFLLCLTITGKSTPCVCLCCLSLVVCFTLRHLHWRHLITFWMQSLSVRIKLYFTHLKRTCVLWCWEKTQRCGSSMDCSYGYTLAAAWGKKGGRKATDSPQMLKPPCGWKTRHLKSVLLTRQLCLRL